MSEGRKATERDLHMECLSHHPEGTLCPGRETTCANCGPLPENERLSEYGGMTVHAVVVRLGNGWGHYNGPTPDELEPCGPVTPSARNPS